MSETAAAPAVAGSPFKDMASLSENFVPRSEYNALLERYTSLSDEMDEISKAAEAYEGIDLGKLQARNVELEGKVRTHNYQAAYKELVDELGINPDFADEVFELAKLDLDKDEPDIKKMKSVLKDFLELKPKFRAPQAEEGETPEQPDTGDREIIADPNAAPTKPRLHTADTSGKGSKATPPGRFPYRHENLSDPTWMAQNGIAYARAIQDGSAYKVG